MKVALCISGSPREFKQSFPSLKEKILDVLNPDIFLSTWDWKYGNKDEERNKLANGNHVFDVSLREMYELYLYTGKLKFFELEIWDKAAEEALGVQEKIKISNIFARSTPMYYKIWKATNLALNYSFLHGFEYDVIIRARPDLTWFNSLDEEELKDIVDNKEGKFIYIRKDSVNPMNEVPYPNWVQDQVFYGSPKSMKLASMTVFNMAEYFTKMERKSPELFLRENCREMGVEMKDSSIRYKLCRE